MNAHTVTVASLSSVIINSHAAQESIFLMLGGGMRIEVKSNSQELLVKLRRYFHEYTAEEQGADITIFALETEFLNLPFKYVIKAPDPGKTKVKEEYVDLPDGRIVRKRLTGMVFMLGGGIHLAAGPCIANDNQVVNFINNRFLERMLVKKGLLAHAAGICRQGRGVAVAGFSGAGKSTLSLRLLEAGADFISNDRLILTAEKEGLRMYGIPKHPRVNPGTLLASPRLQGIIAENDRVALLKLQDDELWHLERKYDVHVHEIFGAGRFRLEAPLECIIVLTWKRNHEKTIIRQVDFSSRRDLLDAFMKPVGLFFYTDSGSVPDLSPAHYMETLKDCPVFEISGGIDFSAATEFISDCAAGGNNSV